MKGPHENAEQLGEQQHGPGTCCGAMGTTGDAQTERTHGQQPHELKSTSLHLPSNRPFVCGSPYGAPARSPDLIEMASPSPDPEPAQRPASQPIAPESAATAQTAADASTSLHRAAAQGARGAAHAGMAAACAGAGQPGMAQPRGSAARPPAQAPWRESEQRAWHAHSPEPPAQQMMGQRWHEPQHLRHAAESEWQAPTAAAAPPTHYSQYHAPPQAQGSQPVWMGPPPAHMYTPVQQQQQHWQTQPAPSWAPAPPPAWFAHAATSHAQPNIWVSAGQSQFGTPVWAVPAMQAFV